MKKKEEIYYQLLDKSKDYFPSVRYSILENTSLLLSLLLVKETVNLHKLKAHVGGILGNHETLVSSHYKRLTRFFNDCWHQRFLWKLLLCFAIKEIVAKLDKRAGGKYLLMDATCWQFGQVKFQFLTLSILFNGVSIPIFWIDLRKKGHSSFSERKRLFQMASCLYDFKGMTLLADREYKGRGWFKWLDEQGIYFIIRLPYGDYKQEVTGKLAYSHLCKKARKGRKVGTEVTLLGRCYQLVAAQDLKDEHHLLLLITNKTKWKPIKVCQAYKLRWKIETMFFHLKSNGFDIEEMGMRKPQKVRLMLALVVVAYVLCICEGIKHMKEIRKQKGTGYGYESIFRKGYGLLVPLVYQIELFLDFIMRYLLDVKIRPKPIKIPHVQ